MILATKIHLRYGSPSYPNEKDIQSIYLSGEGLEGFYPKEQVYDMLVRGVIIRVNIYPYPALVEMTSFKGEKYVRSEPNESPYDNLLNLPRS